MRCCSFVIGFILCVHLRVCVCVFSALLRLFWIDCSCSLLSAICLIFRIVVVSDLIHCCLFVCSVQSFDVCFANAFVIAL